MRSLVVEDEFVARCILQRFLAKHGASDVAVDGEEALAAMKAALATGEPYDLVCLDIWLPGLDGQRVLSELRALEHAQGMPLGRGSRVVMTTSASSKQEVVGAFRGGADAFLIKPITVEALQEELVTLGLLR